MTAAALVPLAFLALMTLIVVLAVRSLSNAKRDDAADADFAWTPVSETYSTAPASVATETYVVPAPVAAAEPPPAAEMIRMPVRLRVINGGRQ
jgi:hypothetical protein